jgi:hypothetical protein
VAYVELLLISRSIKNLLIISFGGISSLIS